MGNHLSAFDYICMNMQKARYIVSHLDGCSVCVCVIFLHAIIEIIHSRILIVEILGFIHNV